MSTFSPLSNPGPFHILTYGTLLGTTIFQSFIGGIVAFRALPRPQFASLQSALFPIYFALQSALPVVLFLTYPSTTLITSPPLTASTTTTTHPPSLSTSASPSALLSPSHRTPLLLLSTMFVCGILNAALIGPMTTACMRERKHQETRDGKKSYEQGPHSKEMQELNKRFGRLHGGSTVVNLLGFGAMVAYGWGLGGRFG